MNQQAKLRPPRTCLYCGYRGRWSDTYGTGRCPDCVIEWQIYEAQLEGVAGRGNQP